jgi:SulP family sulfate permease
VSSVWNIGSSLFGGLCVTGTIARTATNVRAGARTPVAGILHAILLLLFMLLAAPLIAYVPLAALAGLLVTVAWNMIEGRAIAAMSRNARGDLAVLAVTLLLTLLHDLMLGIAAGTALALSLRLFRR